MSTPQSPITLTNGQGCLIFVGLVIIGATCLLLLPESTPEVCKIMEKVDYDYTRAQSLMPTGEDELLKAMLIRSKVNNAYNIITPHSEGLKLYCEDKDSFWGSRYDVYP